MKFYVGIALRSNNLNFIMLKKILLIWLHAGDHAKHSYCM